MRGRAVATILCSFALLSVSLPARALDDAGASTFAGGSRLYRPRAWSADEIPLPPPKLKPVAPAAAAAPSGPTFAIRRFDVVGNTLLPNDEVERTLAPYVDPKASFDTIEKARDALQQRYADEGFIAVAVGVPQQTVEGGSVRLDVTEARIGDVTVKNEGVKWFSDDSVRALTPDIQPGAILRESDLRQDLANANNNPDRIVRPVLAAGKQPGLVDVNLVVDDTIPLHGSVALTNDRTPGSPHSRLETDLSYGNLWDMEHTASLTYITAPTQSSDVLIASATYSAPMPFKPSDRVMGYWAYSDTFSTVPLVAGLGSLGKGQSFGLRYNAALPDLFGSERPLHQGFTAGLDYKDIKSTLQVTNPSDPNDPNSPPITTNIPTPIRYLPFQLSWWSSYYGIDDSLSVSLGDHFNMSGLVSGGDSSDFRKNRSAPGVNGNYHIFVWTLEWRHRLSMADGASFLANLGQSFLGSSWPHTGRSRDSIGVLDDWGIVLRTGGQRASQPLIPTEQYAAGGMANLRGYLQSEVFGDNALAYSVELWTRRFGIDFTPGVSMGLRPMGFWDYACMYNLAPGEGETGRTCLYSIGAGLQVDFLRWFSATLYLTDPLQTTTNTTRGDPRFNFRVTGGF
ncbi:MAG TPA: POTRA domain-containing protein [Myxococcota bacterium]|nr:POTRA domain-containing protein [Myxococcota bacterium]